MQEHHPVLILPRQSQTSGPAGSSPGAAITRVNAPWSGRATDAQGWVPPTAGLGLKAPDDRFCSHERQRRTSQFGTANGGSGAVASADVVFDVPLVSVAS